MKNIEASLFGFIIGDALGVPVEFISRDVLNDNKITDMIANPRRRTTIGYWSDDSAMTLCSMQSIIEHKSIRENDLIEKFYLWFRHGYMAIDNKCFGIGKTTLKAMNDYERLGYPNYIAQDELSPLNRGNGSLMRILPITLFLYYQKNMIKNELCIVIERVSSLTHSDKIVRMACVFYSFLVFSIMDDQSFLEAFDMAIISFKKQYQNHDYSVFERVLSKKILTCDEDAIESSGYVIHTLEACLWSVSTTNNYQDAVLKAVNLGRDSDTIAALSGAIAGLLYGMDDIPEKWLSNLREKDKLDVLVHEYCKVLKNFG